MKHKRVTFAVAALGLSVVLAFAVALTDLGQDSVLGLIAQLEGVVARYYWPGVFIYIAAFAVVITLTLPAATAFTIAGGFLFGAGIGTVAALTGMTLGAALTFALMRVFGVREDSAFLREGRARSIFEILDRNAVFYVTVLRIVPVAPCFAVNAGAAITRIDFTRFLAASVIGLTPASLVYGSVGAGLDSLLEAREVMTPAILLEPAIGLPMVGVLGLISVSWLLRHRLPGLSREA